MYVERDRGMRDREIYGLEIEIEAIALVLATKTTTAVGKDDSEDKTVIPKDPRRAFIEGMAAGFCNGYKRGLEHGYAKGYDAGFKEGYSEAKAMTEMYSEP